MGRRKDVAMLIGLVLSVSLLSVSVTAICLMDYDNRMYVRMLGDVCREIVENQPEAGRAVASALKDCQYGDSSMEGENPVLAYGYDRADFVWPGGKRAAFFAAAGFFAGGALFALTFSCWRRKERGRIRALTDYLEQINTGADGLLLPAGEDDFSKLQDEIYKTVTELYQTRESALKAKNNFAENLYNIAHQIKTPITSISLSVQMMQENLSPAHQERIRRQLSRLTYLEESMLLLSRIDSGALSLERKEVDVLTLLELSADNLQELFRKAEVSVHIEEAGEAVIRVDLEWTMEAVMNLLKNCMEHTPPGGCVHCSYGQNPLYTRIRIWDTGGGFAREDIPHLFERFYRGKNARKDGIGIGLALSKAIIESQDGTLGAGNHADGGACFEISFYAV